MAEDDKDAAPPPTEPNLLKAIADGALEDVKKMLDPGISEAHKKFNALYPEIGGPVNCTDPNTGFPPLMVAAINGRASLCDLLVRKKADMTCVDQRGDSPLHRASIQSDLPVIEALVARGMPVDVRANSGLTPLHYAAIRGNAGVSELLLSLGATATVHDAVFGSTPLHFAAMEVDHSCHHRTLAHTTGCHHRTLAHTTGRLVLFVPAHDVTRLRVRCAMLLGPYSVG